MSMPSARVLLLSALLAPCCWPQPPDQNIASLTGQLFLLPKIGNKTKIQLKRDRLNRIKGGCDVAVQISAAELTHGDLHLRLRNIGYPVIPSQGYSNECQSGAKPLIDLQLTGFAADEPASSVLGTINDVLFTPEHYLAYRGISLEASGETAEQQKQDANPVILLKVEPTYSEQARAQKYSGAITISVIVGEDGRVHSPRIARPLGLGLDENALLVLPLWRFQPGKKGGKPVAWHALVQTSFRLL